MLEYFGFITKAQLYFSRAEEHPRWEDSASALWLLLGLEFLLRAPLARANPVLLAEMNNESIMSAAGLATGGRRPKSIATHMVITRLGAVVSKFTTEREGEATFLIGLRNGELHTSSSTLDIDDHKWLPQFTRVVQVLCDHLGRDPEELIGRELIQQGRSLVDKEDKKLAHEVRQRIKTAKALFARLRNTEIEMRRQQIPDPMSLRRPVVVIEDELVATARISFELVGCPACAEQIPLRLQVVRTTNERLEGAEIHRDVVYIANWLSCPVCGLELTSTAEIRAADLTQQYVRPEVESLEDRYGRNDGLGLGSD